MAVSLTSPERRVIHLSVAVFVLSMILPSYRVWNPGIFSPGYEMAWLVEGIFLEMSWESMKAVLGVSPPPPSSRWDGWPVFLSGACANHLFILAYLTVLFRRYRTAAVFATGSALCGIGCLLPGQIIAFKKGWSLGPGYFVWCAAAVMLAITTVRVARRELKSGPIFDGFFTPRMRHSNVDQSVS